MSNALRYSASRVKDGFRVDVEIRLNDECGNGVQNFAITASIYEWTNLRRAGRPRHVMIGPCHEEILAVFPEFRPFVRLHLADYTGTPLYPVANGYYHLTNGFGNMKRGNPEFEAKFCECYRITPEQFAALANAASQTHYGMLLFELGIRDQWQDQASKAIQELEALTGKTFEIDSKRTQWDGPTSEEIEAETERFANGYYTAEAVEARATAKVAEYAEGLRADCQKLKDQAELTYQVKREVLRVGGIVAAKNCIFYNHNKWLAFNWERWNKLPINEIEKILAELKLPEGVTAGISKNKD